MALSRSPLTLLLAATCTYAPFASISSAHALLPPDAGDPSTSAVGGSWDAFGAGGNAGVEAPPLNVYLDRYTYYVGEVITGEHSCPGCGLSDPIFLDAMGSEIAGAIVVSDTTSGRFVFIPDAPLTVGLYSVILDDATAEFEVIEGQPSLPTYQLTLSEASNPVGEPIECQSSVPGHTATAYPQTRIDAGLWLSFVGESTDQYQYELSVDAGARISRTVGYPLATFRQGDPEFCVEVFALPYDGGAEVTLGTTCLEPDAELILGVLDVPYGSLDSVLAGCELPPDGYADEWCAYHAEAFVRHSCAGFIEDACIQARFDCPEGDLPEWYDENGIDPNDPNAPYDPNDPIYGTGGSGIGSGGNGGDGTGSNTNSTGANGGDNGVGADSGEPGSDGTSSETGGCSCNTGASRSFGAGNGAFFFAGLAGALIALRRRERKFES